MFGGFYTVRFQLGEGVGRSVMYAHAGKLLGGNSAFAHIGTYEPVGDEIAIEVSTVRHNPNPNYRAMAGTDDATLFARGRADGEALSLPGPVGELPNVPFQSVMTSVEEQPIPIAGGVGEGGAVNELYSIHLRTLDGIDGGLTGVMLSATAAFWAATPSSIISAPTPARMAAGRARSSTRSTRRPGAKTPCSAAMRSASALPASATKRAPRSATALAGKRSLRLAAVLKLMRRA